MLSSLAGHHIWLLPYTTGGFVPCFLLAHLLKNQGRSPSRYMRKAESGSAKIAYKPEKQGDSGREIKSIFKYRWSRQTGEMRNSKFQNYTKYWGRRVIQFDNNIWGLKRVRGPPRLVWRGMEYANLSQKEKDSRYILMRSPFCFDCNTGKPEYLCAHQNFLNRC